MPVRIPATSHDETGIAREIQAGRRAIWGGSEPDKIASPPVRCAGQGGCPSARRVLRDVRQQRHERHQLDGSVEGCPSRYRPLTSPTQCPHQARKGPLRMTLMTLTPWGMHMEERSRLIGPRPPRNRCPTGLHSWAGGGRQPGFRGDPAGSVTMELGPKSSN
jgi:hypothetical protein